MHTTTTMFSKAAMSFYPAAVTSAKGANSVCQEITTVRLKRPSRSRSHPSSPMQRLLQAVLHTASILASLVAHLDWIELYPLLCSCKGLYDIIQDLPLRDVVLSRFLQGYAFCLRHRDMLLYQDVPITTHDLNVLRPSLFF